MKILVVSQYYNPEQFQINEICPELVRRGHQVTVLTGLPNYPKGVVPKEYKFGRRRDEMIDGVRVVRCTEFGRKKGKINLILNYASFAIFGSLKAKGLREEFDVIVSYGLSPITSTYPALAYKKKHNIPLLLYCLDIWPESAQAHVHNDKGRLYRTIWNMSKNIYSKCDCIAVTSKPFIEYLNQKNGFPEERTVYIPQHADSSMLETDLKAEENGIADFMFAGNFGNGQVLHNIILAVAELKDKGNFKVHMVGDGSRANDIKKLAAEKGVEDKVIFYGNQPRDKMPDFYKMADALLITLRGNNFVGNTMPGKLQMYMAAGKPVFGAINGAAPQVIEEAGCGACAPAEDYKGLAELMANYIDHPEKYQDCGQNAREYFKENFTLEVYCNRLEQVMAALKGENHEV